MIRRVLIALMFLTGALHGTALAQDCLPELVSATGGGAPYSHEVDGAPGGFSQNWMSLGSKAYRAAWANPDAPITITIEGEIRWRTASGAACDPRDGQPLPGDTLPPVQDTLPAYQDTLPPVQDTLIVQDTLPAVQDTLPAYQDTLPPVQDTIPFEVCPEGWTCTPPDTTTTPPDTTVWSGPGPEPRTGWPTEPTRPDSVTFVEIPNPDSPEADSGVVAWWWGGDGTGWRWRWGNNTTNEVLGVQLLQRGVTGYTMFLTDPGKHWACHDVYHDPTQEPFDYTDPDAVAPDRLLPDTTLATTTKLSTCRPFTWPAGWEP